MEGGLETTSYQEWLWDTEADLKKKKKRLFSVPIRYPRGGRGEVRFRTYGLKSLVVYVLGGGLRGSGNWGWWMPILNIGTVWPKILA